MVGLFGCTPRLSASEPFLFFFQLTIYLTYQILLDLAMPRLNGAEAATILKNALPETPIILFTMYTDLHVESLSGFLGVDFMKYPFGSGARKCYESGSYGVLLCAECALRMGFCQ